MRAESALRRGIVPGSQFWYIAPNGLFSGSSNPELRCATPSCRVASADVAELISSGWSAIRKSSSPRISNEYIIAITGQSLLIFVHAFFSFRISARILVSRFARRSRRSSITSFDLRLDGGEKFLGELMLKSPRHREFLHDVMQDEFSPLLMKLKCDTSKLR
jgi:hypothetical protein